jgi:hypothetical protein
MDKMNSILTFLQFLEAPCFPHYTWSFRSLPNWERPGIFLWGHKYSLVKGGDAGLRESVMRGTSDDLASQKRTPTHALDTIVLRNFIEVPLSLPQTQSFPVTIYSPLTMAFTTPGNKLLHKLQQKLPMSLRVQD